METATDSISASERTPEAPKRSKSVHHDPPETSESAPYEPPADFELVEVSKPIQVEPSIPINSEFVSGEVSAIDSESKTMTLKLYTPGDKKELTVNFDGRTELVSNGETDKEGVTSLQSGVSVDLRYDPSNNRALYIYIY